MKPGIKDFYNSSQKTLELNGTSQAQLSLLLDKKNNLSLSNQSRKKPYSFVFLCISIFIFCYITFNAYRFHKIPENLDEIPLIRADISPLKIIPTDIGGEQFSNQDKLIYNNFEDQKIAKYQKKVIKAQQKIEINNPVIDAASKKILDTDQSTKPNQTEKIEKMALKNKNLKQKQTTIKGKSSSSELKNKNNNSSSIFDLLD